MKNRPCSTPTHKPPQGNSEAFLLLAGGEQHPLHLCIASRFLQRFLGLMLSNRMPWDQALLITGCRAVHTCFMRYAIDVLYLDRHGVVLHCVKSLKPWRNSVCPRSLRAAHTLELTAGAIEHYGVSIGSRLLHPELGVAGSCRAAPRPSAQQGATMVEFTVVGPIITLLGLGVLQYGMLFFAKNHINYASFMAARAGSTGNADLIKVRQAYVRALIPLYGGGRNSKELGRSLAKASADVTAYTRIELLNPTKESFEDWNDPDLQKTIGKGRRVIPNAGLAYRNPAEVKTGSGQNIHDANLIKLRITHGVALKIPLIRQVYAKYLQWLDPHNDATYTRMVADGRLPVVTHVTLQMQSDAIEPKNPVSLPGPGNNGNPSNGDGPSGGNPREPDVPPDNPPDCPNGDCSGQGGTDNPDPVECDPDTAADCVEQPPVICNGQTVTEPLATDFSFGFDSATLTEEGQAALDQLIAQLQDKTFDAITLTGHTDPLGSETYNLDLSRRRAQAVKDYLHGHGLQNAIINVEGKGESDPVKTETDCPAGPDQKACYAPNRRVDVTVHNLRAQTL